jgi:hypothetical protein
MAFTITDATIRNVNDADATAAASDFIPMSRLLRAVAEEARESATKDAKFFKSLLYYFELEVPKKLSPGPNKYLYPLVLPPESYGMTEPFAVEQAFTLGGGLFVEEQGVVARTITLSGTTGWAPRKQKGPVSNFNFISAPQHRTWRRDVTKTVKALTALSGQRHFQFLQDTVFRTYGDLKQDPATSEDTKLYFHNVQDDEHWRVFPMSFSMSRSVAQPLLYKYDIQLLAVAPESVPEEKLSEDGPVMAALRNPFRVIKSAVDNIRAAVLDLSAVTGELRAVNGKFTSLLDGAVGIADAAEKFLDGTATLIAQPLSLVENTMKAGNDALLEWNTGVASGSAIGPPANLLNSIRKIIDSLALIGSYPGSFRNSIQAEVDKFLAQASLAYRNKASLKAAVNNIPSTLRGFSSQARGTTPNPGDYARSLASLGLGQDTPRYASAVEYVLEMGDSLENLAARYLGDARNWKYIALFNGLKAPFISQDGLPGTLRWGDKILIPSTAAPAVVATNPAVLGTRANEPGAVQALGRDLLLTAVDRDQFDLVIDADGGGIDIKLTDGVANLKQAIRTRIITEKGTDILYRNLGCSRVVGLGLTEVDLETAKIRLVEAVGADPRIAAVTNVTFNLVQPDGVEADLTAEVRGFSRPEQVVVVTPVV